MTRKKLKLKKKKVYVKTQKVGLQGAGKASKKAWVKLNNNNKKIIYYSACMLLIAARKNQSNRVSKRQEEQSLVKCQASQ